FGQQPPELGVIPAERVPGGITVPADTRAQPPHLRLELFAGHGLEVLVHRSASSCLAIDESPCPRIASPNPAVGLHPSSPSPVTAPTRPRYPASHRQEPKMKLEALRSRILAPLERFAWVGPLAVRLSLGAVFLGTGWGKLHNLGQVTSFFTELGIPFPTAQAALVSGIGLVGGTLILLGLFTRLAAMPLLGRWVGAIVTPRA